MPFIELPDWLISCFRIALLGEIYPAIRAISIGYDEDKNVLIRYYLDREPEEFDIESLEVVATNLDSLGGEGNSIRSINVEGLYTVAPGSSLDPLSGFVYFRREY